MKSCLGLGLGQLNIGLGLDLDLDLGSLSLDYISASRQKVLQDLLKKTLNRLA